jgi:hypothetical protein
MCPAGVEETVWEVLKQRVVSHDGSGAGSHARSKVTSRSSWSWIQSRSQRVGCRAKICRIFRQVDLRQLRDAHEPGLQVRGHGEVALERPSAIGGANLGAKDKGVVVVEGGGWLDDDGSRRVRHEIFGKIPYLARQLSVF